LAESFHEVAEDLRDAGATVDLWLTKIAAVLQEFGYEMQILSTGELHAGRAERSRQAEIVIEPCVETGSGGHEP